MLLLKLKNYCTIVQTFMVQRQILNLYLPVLVHDRSFSCSQIMLWLDDIYTDFITAFD